MKSSQGKEGRVVSVVLPSPFKGRCGRDCPFCNFDWSDDMYHCTFFKSRKDTDLINLYAEEKDLYEKCPVKVG